MFFFAGFALYGSRKMEGDARGRNSHYLSVDPNHIGVFPLTQRLDCDRLSIFKEFGSIATTGLISYHLPSFIPKLEHLDADVFVQFALWFGALLVGSGLFLGLYRGALHLDNRRPYLLARRTYFYSVLIALASFYILLRLDIPQRYTLLFFLTLPVLFTFGKALLHSFNKLLQWFLSLEHAQTKIDRWRHEYKEHRPHSSLGYRSPQKFIKDTEVAQTSAASFSERIINPNGS